jgi:hypothetical protein
MSDTPPDVWALLDELRQYVIEYGGLGRFEELARIDVVLAQRDRWQLVPKEPTEEILYAMHHQIDFDRTDQNTEKMEHESQTSCGDGMGGVIHAGSTIKQDMLDAYHAALTAAPKPEKL